MNDMSAVTDTFHAIVLHAEEGAPSSASTDASAALVEAIGKTIMPRVISVSAGQDARISVIARNRRVLSVVDTNPVGLWAGDDTTRDAGSDGFASAFVDTVVALSAEGPAVIETALVDGSLPSSALSGYPALRLKNDIEARQKAAPTAASLDAFYEEWAGHARIYSAGEILIDLPEGSPIDAKWMRIRLSEWIEATGEDRPSLRFVTTEDTSRMAIAFASVGDTHCVVVSHDPDTFDKLEAALAALLHYGGEG